MKTIPKNTAQITAVVLGLLLAAALALAPGVDAAETTNKKAEKKIDKIVFASDRTSGQGVNNPEGDFEIFSMNPDGKGRKQLTENAADDFNPTLSPNSKSIAFTSQNVQSSNPEGDSEIYLMNTDGSDPQNLTETAGGISDSNPNFSPDGEKIAYSSSGVQPSNTEGDDEVYKMNASDGSNQENLTDTADGIQDNFPDYASDDKHIVYDSDGNQSSNPEGDDEIYLMNAKGSNKRNLTDTSGSVNDSTPDFGEAKKG